MEAPREPDPNISVPLMISLESNLPELVAIPDSGHSPLERMISREERSRILTLLREDPRERTPAPLETQARLDRSTIWMQKASPLVKGLEQNGVVAYGQLHKRLRRLALWQNIDGNKVDGEFEDLLKGKFFKGNNGESCYKNTGNVTKLFELTCRIAHMTVEQALTKPQLKKIVSRKTMPHAHADQP